MKEFVSTVITAILFTVCSLCGAMHFTGEKMFENKRKFKRFNDM